jgi:hypothetical protein
MLDDKTGATVVFSEMPTIARTAIDMYKQAVSKIVDVQSSWHSFIHSRKQTFFLGEIFKQAGRCSSEKAGTCSDRMANTWTACRRTERMENTWTGWQMFRQDSNT